MFRQADAEHRPLTAEERTYAQGLVDEAQEMAKSEKQIQDIGRQLGGPALDAFTDPNAADHGGRSGPGDVLVESAGFKSIADPTTRGQQWTTGLIEVGRPLQMKGTLLEGSGSPGSGSGGGLVPVPQLAPGIVYTLFQPLTIEGLLSADLATGNTVRFVNEGTATSAAAGVAEGGLKPESTLGLGTIDEPVKKVATTLTMSDEILEDVPAVQSLRQQPTQPVRQHRDRASADSRHVRRQRSSGPLDCSQRPDLCRWHRRRNQGRAAIQSHEWRPRLGVRRTRVDRYAPVGLPGSASAQGHSESVPGWRSVDGPVRRRATGRCVQPDHRSDRQHLGQSRCTSPARSVPALQSSAQANRLVSGIAVGSESK